MHTKNENPRDHFCYTHVHTKHETQQATRTTTRTTNHKLQQIRKRTPSANLPELDDPYWFPKIFEPIERYVPVLWFWHIPIEYNCTHSFLKIHMVVVLCHRWYSSCRKCVFQFFGKIHIIYTQKRTHTKTQNCIQP